MDSNLVNEIKVMFGGRTDIDEKFYFLIAEYLENLNAISKDLGIDVVDVAMNLPDVIKSIKFDSTIAGYGEYKNQEIFMNPNLDKESLKLYFFHELTHAVQTHFKDGKENCAFYNETTGMFLTEAVTQYTAEILYSISSNKDMNRLMQPRVVRGVPEKTVNSPLSEYQLNGNILSQLAIVLDVPLPKLLGIAYQKDAREQLKKLYESKPGNEDKFEEFMYHLEEIYTVDKLLIYGYYNVLNKEELVKINPPNKNGVGFQSNLNKYKNLQDYVEMDLYIQFLYNNDIETIKKHADYYDKIITSDIVRQEFRKELNSIIQKDKESQILKNENNLNKEVNSDKEVLEQEVDNNSKIVENSESINSIDISNYLKKYKKNPIKDRIFYSEYFKEEKSFKEKVLGFIASKEMLMKIPFFKNLVNKQIALPEGVQENNKLASNHSEKEVEEVEYNSEVIKKYQEKMKEIIEKHREEHAEKLKSFQEKYDEEKEI